MLEVEILTAFLFFLSQVTPDFFSTLSADSLKINLFNSLLSLLATTQRSEVAVMVKDCIKKVTRSYCITLPRTSMRVEG